MAKKLPAMPPEPEAPMALPSPQPSKQELQALLDRVQNIIKNDPDKVLRLMRDWITADNQK